MKRCIAGPAHSIKERENTTTMIQMKVGDKYFIQQSRMYTHTIEIAGCSWAYVKDKVVTIT